MFKATENSMSSGTALITGASSGIGAIYADRLARRGHDLILVARNRERLDALARRLSDDTGRAVTVIVADLNDKADLAQVEQVLRSDAGITILVNNAGIALTGDLADTDPDRLDRMIHLNVLAPTRLARAAIPGFVARPRHPDHYQVGPGTRTGVVQRQLQRGQGLSAQSEREVAAGTGRHGRSRAGRATGCDEDGALGKGWYGHREPAAKRRDGCGRHGRRRAGRTRQRRAGDHPRTA